jgi:rubredoxin
MVARLMARPRKYQCTICQHVYDPAQGDPDSGIAPGTPFENLPDDWCCPDCGARKEDFEPLED